MQKGNEFRVHVRRVFKRIFYLLLDPALADPLKKHSPGLMFFTRH